jgi:C1A family cysteine protease
MNKTTILIAFTAVLAALAYNSIADSSSLQTLPLKVSAAHQNWMVSQGKLYGSPEELQFRLSVFHKSYNLVVKHNADPEATWTMELNQFADMTSAEIKTKYLGDMSDIDSAIYSEKGEEHVVEENEVFGASVDWRRYVPTTVLNQGQCGSCWAFATASTAEAIYNKKTGKKLQFSPQQILDCSASGSCSGGQHAKAMKYYKKVGGVKITDYTYQGA